MSVTSAREVSMYRVAVLFGLLLGLSGCVKKVEIGGAKRFERDQKQLGSAQAAIPNTIASALGETVSRKP